MIRDKNLVVRKEFKNQKKDWLGKREVAKEKFEEQKVTFGKS